MEIFISKPNLHKLSHLEDGMITQLTHCSHPFVELEVAEVQLLGAF